MYAPPHTHTFLKKIFSGVPFYCVLTNQNLAWSQSLWGTVRVVMVFTAFFFLSCKEIVSRGCVVFSQTWMSSNNLLSLYPPLADILSLPYIRPVLS